VPGSGHNDIPTPRIRVNDGIGSAARRPLGAPSG
jgi:hypothetical protein